MYEDELIVKLTKFISSMLQLRFGCALVVLQLCAHIALIILIAANDKRQTDRLVR